MAPASHSEPNEHDQEASRFEGAPATALPLTASQDRHWATMAHFGGVLMCIPSLIIFLVFKDRGPFTAQESKEALNFTLPPSILALIALLLSQLPGIGGFFAVVHAIIWVVVTIFSVLAGIEVERGRPYRYDFNLRLIR